MDFDETLDDFADDFDTVFNANLDTTNTPGTSVNNKSSVNAFEILSIDDVTLHVNNIVEEVTPILNLPATTTRILLGHYKWKREELIDDYYENGDPMAFLASKHVADPFDWCESTDEAGECKICYTESNSITGLQCGHKYCEFCWNQYLRTQIMDEGIAESIKCIEPNCDIIVDDENVMKLVQEAEVRQKYNRIMVNSFIENNETSRWCPTAGCTYAVKITNIALKEKAVCACKCGQQFCFGCGEMWHEPITCRMLDRWLKQDDSETLKWIATNAKICPGCKAAIEKNGGCNHMTCRKCRHEFCWICLANWRGHQACNRFQEQRGEVGFAHMERFKHFREHYVTQLESIKLERKLHESLGERLQQLKDFDMCNAETRFLKEAMETLYLCRQTLTYTYVFAFYLEKCNQSDIFEDSQSHLQSSTERLSEYLEHEVTADNLKDMKQRILDTYIYCKKRRDVLLDHVREGNEKKWWTYSI